MGYYILYGFLWVGGLLPLRILYFFSDIYFYLIYYLLKYRRRVVRANLQHAFPEKDLSEIIKIEKRYYRHLCDFFVEMYKMCQYISLHIPATEQTKKSINYDLLKNMPKGAVLINTARKEVIDEEGLAKLMEERADFHYITDIAPDCDCFSKFEGRFFATPKKMGAQTEEANVNAGLAAAHQIVNFIEKGDEKFRVNK